MTQPLPLPLTVPDVVDVLDLDPLGTETTSDLQTLEQDVLHVLIEQPGSNPDDLTRGIGIEGYLSGTSVDLSKVTALIDQQLTQDDRITSSQTSIGQLANGTWRIDIRIVATAGIFGLSYGYSQPTGLTVNR